MVSTVRRTVDCQSPLSSSLSALCNVRQSHLPGGLSTPTVGVKYLPFDSRVPPPSTTPLFEETTEGRTHKTTEKPGGEESGSWGREGTTVVSPSSVTSDLLLYEGEVGRRRGRRSFVSFRCVVLDGVGVKWFLLTPRLRLPRALSLVAASGSVSAPGPLTRRGIRRSKAATRVEIFPGHSQVS